MLRTTALALLAGLVTSPAHAISFTLDLNSLANGAVVVGPGGLGTGSLNAVEIGNETNVLGTVGVSVSYHNGVDAYGVVFDTSVTTNSDSDLQQSPFTAGSKPVTGITSPFGAHTKTLIIQNMGSDPAGCSSGLCTTPNDNAAGGTIAFDFSSLTASGVKLTKIPLFEFETDAKMTLLLANGDTFDMNNALLIEGIGNDASGIVDLDTFIAGYSTDTNPTTVVGLELEYHSSGSIGFDGFLAEYTVTTTVPLPASLTLLLAGAAGLGLMGSRRG